MTSNACLQKVKWLFGAAKAGHTGSLDPMATGVLPLCFGEATKFSQYLLDADKHYCFTIRFGMTTATGDAEGEETSRQPSWHIREQELSAVLVCFRGVTEQVPSMYSAIKHQGQPLYKLARQGVEVERQARSVTIHTLVLKAFRAGREQEGLLPEADLEAHVSKGTYIRTLAEDIGRKLDCGAHISRLHRSKAGPFTDMECITVDELESLRVDQEPAVLDRLLMPVSRAIEHLQIVRLPVPSGFYLQQGQSVMDLAVLKTTRTGDIVRVVLENGEFLGVAEIQEDGRIAPRRLLRTAGSRQ